MAEKDKTADAQDKNQNPLLSGRVKPETKDRFDAYKAWLKADDGGEITYDDVVKDLLDNSASAEWGTTHPRTAHAVAHTQSLLSRVRAEFVAIADQVEVAEAEAEEKVRKQLDALSDTVSAQKRELEGEDGKPGLRKLAAERDALAAELEAVRSELAAAQEAAASSSAAAEEARAAEDGAKAQLSEIQAENRTLVERAMSAEAQLAEQANQHKIEMLTAKADADRALAEADRAHADAVAVERAAAQDALDALRERMDADAAAERRKAEDALDALRGELTSAKEAAASAESARQAAEGRASRLETELAGEREDRIGAQRDLALLQREHAATEAQLARAQAEVEELKKRPAEVSNG